MNFEVENGEIAGEYLKQHPVPFGEYIPFRRYLDWIPPLSLVPRDMIRGEGQEIFELGEKNIKISPQQLEFSPAFPGNSSISHTAEN